MNPANVPPWGCPWHGLVKGGQLQLPNGTSMAYRQPSGGDTTLVAHPDASGAAGLSVEQQAAAAEAGMQWWDRAIISGGQIYGQQAGLNWLYIDPAAAVWAVNLYDTGVALNITLQRFGVLGGTPQRYDYTAPPALESPGGSLTVRHTTKTGNRAIISNAGSTGGGAWVEVILSGNGENCLINTEVKYSWVDGFGVEGSISTEPPKIISIITSSNDVIPPPAGFKRYIDTQIIESDDSFSPNYYGARGSWVSSDSSVKGLVLNGFYREDDSLVFLKADYGYRINSTADYKILESTPGILRTRDNPADNISILATATIEYSRTDRQELFFKIYAGAAPIFYESAWRETRRETTEMVEGSPFTGVSPIAGQNTISKTDYLWSSGSTAAGAPSFGGASRGSFPYVENWRRQDGTTTRLDMRVAIASNTLSLIRISDLGRRVSDIYSVTPSGVQYHGEMNATRTTYIYGSWCPVTGRAAVDFSPVCWV